MTFAVGCPASRLGDSSITFSLRIWRANASDAKLLESTLYEKTLKQFDVEEIQIPTLRRNVILKSIKN